ncbi:ABC transporter-like protein [Paucilactobacillus vaccinostercus DSM 20634]|uniref:ABC transporter-like protein n=1 Tax=Paucilactobacillus vaccinostercus DSM 20634 TaxID=1423813 RepID=A0A0R2A9U7_9LACO|nr:ABC-F family ATP-binding cassette domain-containing protein [Paucilactobacillus vaccinostercus]KRM60454.1 ABC transporter-like protein [Paucilactobacillus vaccinostercus DSM 20634]
MLLLQTNNVARRFGAETLFHKINFQIQDRGRVALVGRNGAGKTTLLKIIAGINPPDDGDVSMRKDCQIGYLAQDQGLSSDQTIWDEMNAVFAKLHQQERQIQQLEQQISSLDPQAANYQDVLNTYDQVQNAFSQNGGYTYEAKIKSVLHGFHFEADRYKTVINTLSGGQKTQIALAKLLLQEPDLLILDEPTNHLDMQVLAWLEDYLKSYDGALLLVSHDRYFLDRIVNEVFDLENQTLTHYSGNYSAFTTHKQERLKAEWKQYEKQQTEINKLEDFVNRNIVRASTTKRAQARRKQLEKMDRLDRPEVDDSSIHFTFSADHPSGNIVLDVADATIGYPDKVLAHPVNFEIRKHQRVAIIGPNGVGKSTLLKSILNKISLLGGRVKTGANVQIGYYDQEQQVLHPQKTVLEEVWDDYPTVDEKDIRSLLGSFLFVGDDVFKPVSALSGGEKARLQLTKLSFEHANFLILDEPTNHLDIDSREVLEQAINEFDGTVLFVSHDRYFINQVATDILALDQTGAQHFVGNYDDYLIELAKQAGAADDTVTTTVSVEKQHAQKSFQQSKEQQKQLRKLARVVEEYETQMNELETRQTAIETEMAQPELASDGVKLADLQKELDHLTAQLGQVEEDWTTAAESLEIFQEELDQ